MPERREEKNISAFDVSIARYHLGYEYDRQTYDALVLPVKELDLTAAEKGDYCSRALFATSLIDWDRYDRTRTTFFGQADKLLRPYKNRLSDPEMKDLRRRMYIRFMEGRIRFFEFLEKQENAKLLPIEPGEFDFHNTELASVFAHLPPQPETEAWLKDLDVSWAYDQLYMVTWFSGQLSLGSGNYSRSRPNHSAKVTYERLLNPFSLLWIAAALGEDRELVERTRKEMDDYVSWRAKCGVVRRAVPWSRIYGLALPLAEEERSRK